MGEVGFLSEPQRWNLYAYAVNNPLRYTDPNGTEAGSFSLFNGTHLIPEPGGNRIESSRGSTREMQFYKGAGQVTLGVGLIATAAVGDIPGSTGAFLVANAALGAKTATVSGVVDMTTPLTNTDGTKAQSVLAATSNLGGLVVSAATGGDLKTGQASPTLTSVRTLDENPAGAMRNPATMVKAAKTRASALSLFTNIVNSAVDLVLHTSSTSSAPCMLAA